jgi:O-antigen/teichoic acid export membrane protein
VSIPARRKKSFVGDVFKLVSGTAIAQSTGVLITPVLTRLYAPEAFGLLSLFTSIISILGVIACMRYEFAIMLPESDEEAATILGLSLILTVLMALLPLPMLWWGQGLLLAWLNARELAPYLWLVSPAILVSGTFTALNYWNSRTERFGRLSVATVTKSGATHLMELVAGCAGLATAGSLIGATIGGHALATAILSGQTWREDGKAFLQSINWRGVLHGLKRYRKFPLYSTWSALLGTASWQLPAFLLARYFSSTIVGYYALGFRILQLPAGLIGSAIGQVFFQRSTERHLQGQLTPLVEGVFSSLAAIILVPVLVLTVIGKDLFIVILGPSWAEAGVYAQILAIWGFVWFVCSPLTVLQATLEMQEFGVKINILRFVSRLLALVVGGLLGNPRLAIGFFAAAGVVVYGYHVLVLLKASGVSNSAIVRSCLHPLILSVPACVLLVSLKILQASSWIQVGVGAISVLVYYAYLVKKDPAIGAIIRQVGCRGGIDTFQQREGEAVEHAADTTKSDN